MTRPSPANPSTPRTGAADPAVLPPSGGAPADPDDEPQIEQPPNPEAHEPL